MAAGLHFVFAFGEARGGGGLGFPTPRLLVMRT